MGTFRKTIGLGNPEGGDEVKVDALIDTGAAHSRFPATLLELLDIEPVAKRQITFADGKSAELDVGLAAINIDEERWPCPVIFSPDAEQCLLGATALEIFDLIVDPVEGRLERRQYFARPL